MVKIRINGIFAVDVEYQAGRIEALRVGGYRGHLIAGGHFASLNCEWLLNEFPAFDSVGLGEGEELMCRLADFLVHLDQVAGICYRGKDGEVLTNPSTGNPDHLDDPALPQAHQIPQLF